MTDQTARRAGAPSRRLALGLAGAGRDQLVGPALEFQVQHLPDARHQVQLGGPGQCEIL